jgi:hypothetical protein
MTDRLVIFVKEYAKVNNFSYNCSMCEIKNKGLYTPLNKEAKK